MANSAFWEARIAATEASIAAYETAIDTLVAGGQSYTLDTGQTRMTVTRANVTELERALDRLLSRLQYYEQMLYGRARILRPAT